jgi:Low-density lipoprotein receptor repeat class B
MTKSEVSKPEPVTSGSKATVGYLFVLDLSGGRIFSVNADGSDQKVLVIGCRHPDGIVVDVEAWHIYWTNMGVPNLNDGSIERADLDGRNRKIIVPKGGTFTPNSYTSIRRTASSIGRIGKECESCAVIWMVQRLKLS